jgi:hypothetical protein
MGTSGSFPGEKLPGREADHSPPSSAEVKNAWSYTSIPPNIPSWSGSQLKEYHNVNLRLIKCIIELLKKEHRDLYTLAGIVTIETCMRLRWVEHVARVRKKNIYCIFVLKPLGKRSRLIIRREGRITLRWALIFSVVRSF